MRKLFLLSILLTLLVSSSAQAVVNFDDTAEVKALVAKVNWLKAHKGDNAGQKQKENYRSQVTNLTKAAKALVAPRLSSRDWEDIAYVNSVKDPQLAQAKVFYDQAVAQIELDYKDTVRSIQLDREDTLQGIKEEWGSEINPARKQAKRLKKRFGSTHKKVKNSRARVAELVRRMNLEINLTEEAFKDQFTQAKLSRDAELYDALLTHNEEVASINEEAGAMWSELHAQNVAQYNAELNKVEKLKNDGFNYISQMK